MNDECRNDCVEPIQFPKWIKKRPGLPHIDYRIGTYSDFREALLRKLNQNPVLSAWTHREADDPGIALLEGASILGDILTFYQELYANEAYLRTAQWRESITDLVRLVGYRLSPGVGGKSTFALEVSGDKPVTIPAGFPIQAQLEGIDEPVDFETIKVAIAHPELSQFNLYRPYSIPDIDNGKQSFAIDTEVLIKENIELNPGDRLLLAVDPSNSRTQRQIVIIEDIQERFDKTEITIEGSWRGGKAGLVYAYKLGRSFRHFGYNSPTEKVVVKDSNTVTEQIKFIREIGLESGEAVFAYSHVVGVEQRYNPVSAITSMPLDIEVDDISLESTMLVQLQLSRAALDGWTEHFFERNVTQVMKASYEWGVVSGGTTVIQLNATVSTEDLIKTDIRSIEFLEVIGKPFRLQCVYEEIPSDLTTLFYFGSYQTYRQLDEKSLLFVKQDGTHEEIFASIDPSISSSDNRVKLRPVYLSKLSENFTIGDFPLEQLEEPPVTIYGNLIEANQGKTEKEAMLGNGDSRQTFQTFKLPKAPLTYHNTPGETPPETPELEIYVNDVRWKRAPSFFNRKPKEQIYIVREDANGDSWVQFGDGKTGARLPSGIKNVIAKYRTGIGAHGVLKENTTVQVGGKLDNLDEIQLPGVVSGGNEPESGEKAKEAAPGKIQSLDRLVSLRDFETEALAIPGVAKVTAAWALVDNVPNVVLTLLMETGREKEFEAVEAILNHYNRCRGPQRFPITVRQGRRRYVYIDATFGLHPDYREEVVKGEIKKALGLNGKADNGSGLLSLRQRMFGQREYATRIEGTIQNVGGVVWAKVTALGSLGEADEPSELHLPNPRPQPLLTVPCGDTQILSLYTGHLQLNVSKVAPTEVC